MATTHTVVKGDTLWGIAERYLGSGLKYTQLAAINNIPNPNLIYVGQVIKLVSDGSSGSSANNTTQAVINQFGLQSDSNNTMFATWSWSRSNTDGYEAEWCYDTGDGVWFVGSRSTTKETQSTYTIPSNAKQIRFRVKPISETYQSNNKTTSYWTASWSSAKTYDTSNTPPVVPSTPVVEIVNYTLTAELNDINAEKLKATGVQFQIVKNDTTIYNTGKATIDTNLDRVSYSCGVAAGGEYKVRCRSYRGSLYSAWSNYTTNTKTPPTAVSALTACRASSATSVYLAWDAATSATSYEIEYATKKDYFDKTSETTVKSGITLTYFELTGLESGQEYFFRVRAVNEKGSSGWSDISSVIIGKDPAAPTTWSSTTTVVTGEDLTLYWVHNSEDNSSQTYAELELYINGVKEIHTIQNTTDEELKDLTSSYIVKTSAYVEGTEIKWRVRTAGVTKVYGDWSIERVVDVYAPPTLELTVTDSSGVSFETLTSFPFSVRALAGPNTQVPTGYSLTVTSTMTYETVDHVGNPKVVNVGENVYSKYFDISSPLSVTLSAGDMDLENNIEYTVTCVVSMDSGLTATSTFNFTVAWSDEYFAPNAEISIDKESLVAHIRPYCEELHVKYYVVNRNYDIFTVTTTEIKSGVYGTPVPNAITETGEQVYFGVTAEGEDVNYCEVITKTLVENTTLAVYRREFDGSFVKLAEGLDNSRNTFVTDPHPALDLARYRIVSTMNDTGAVSYYDVPGYPVGETAVIIQWDETWSNFDVTSEDALEQPAWAGSLLKLPYNIDVSDNNKSDVDLVEYIGRKHPVAYYGTQVGHTSTWNVDIVHNDEETLYALRRLQSWMGDVYVREPSGSGYWANITLSFNQKHRELAIPVTMNITRVEGGV